MAEDLRTRVLDATFAEVGENGLRGLTVEAVAARASSSRATIYRHFPGGRDELIETTVRREVSRFFASLLAELPGPDDVVTHVEAIVIGAHRRFGEHRILQRLLVDEAEAIVPSLATVQPSTGRSPAGRTRSSTPCSPPRSAGSSTPSTTWWPTPPTSRSCSWPASAPRCASCSTTPPSARC